MCCLKCRQCKKIWDNIVETRTRLIALGSVETKRGSLNFIKLKTDKL